MPAISEEADASAPAAKIASYSADQVPASSHADTAPSSVLTDGKWANAAKQSVEYKNDVVVTAKLESAAKVEEAVVYSFLMTRSVIESIGVEVSVNGTDWDAVAVQPVTFDVLTVANVPAYELAIPVKREAAYVRVSVKRAAGSARVLLGEIAVR